MAAGERKIRAEDLFRIKVPQSVDISPDGGKIVYAVQSIEEKKNRYSSRLFVAPFRGGKSTPLTRGGVVDSAPSWSPDGARIAFVSNREKETNDIWVIPVAGGEASRLTDLGGGPIRALSWSPDGKSLLFLHRKVPKTDPEKKKLQPSYKHITRLYHKLDGMGWFLGERWQLYTVLLRSGATSRITDGPYDVEEASWSPDGKRIAFLSNRLENPDMNCQNLDLYTIAAGGGRMRKVTTRPGCRGSIAWTMDGRSILFCGNHAKPGEWIQHPMPVRKIRVSGGTEEVLTPDVDNWTLNSVITDTLPGFNGILKTYIVNGEERAAFLYDEEGASRIYSVPVTGGAMRLEFDGDVNVVHFAVAKNGGQAAVVAGEMDTAGEIFSAALSGERERKRVTRLNSTLFRSLKLTEPEEVWFRNGKTRIQGWILKPPGFRKGRKYPCVLQVHGGPMGQYGYTFFHEMHLLAAHGYIVVFSNPRGSSGRGLRYMNCIEGNWGKLDYSDCMAVVNSMSRRSYVDGSRLGILGGSYGGFMTQWVVGHTNRFKAAVTQRALGNWVTEVGSSDIGWDAVHEVKALPWENPQKYLRLSPNTYVKNIRTPLLIIHSEEDLRCPIAQAEELFTYLKMLGRTTEFIRFEGESHGLSRDGKPMNRLERLNRIVDWFHRYL